MLQVNVIHKQQGPSGSHCLILDIKISNNLLLFMVLETKGHNLGAKYNVVCVPYFTIFGFLQ